MVDPQNGTAISGRDVIEKVLDSGVQSLNADEVSIGTAQVYVQETAPSSPDADDIWIDNS